MEFRDEFVSRLREANVNDGPDVFTAHSTPAPRSGIPRVYRRTEAAPPRGWGYWLLLFAVAVLAYGVGSLTHATAIPSHKPNQAAGEPPAEVVTVTVTKEVTVTKTVPGLPKECSDALQLAVEMEQESGPIIDSGGQTTDILKEARIAIAERDQKKLNSLGTQVNGLQNKMSGSTAKMLDLQSRFAAKLKDCNRVLGR